jgi:cell division topological specificity factor
MGNMMGKNIFESLFGKKAPSSGTIARDRLRFVIAQDRATIPEHVMEELRAELLKVIARYIDIDQENLGLDMARDDDGGFILRADIPVRRVRSVSEQNVR